MLYSTAFADIIFFDFSISEITFSWKKKIPCRKSVINEGKLDGIDIDSN